jgi:hypothetical protein
MDKLIAAASRVRTFLGLAALFVVALVFVITSLFSQGSFDPLIERIGILDNNQFLAVVLTVLGMIFFILILLTVLSYRTIQPTAKPESGVIYVHVHEQGKRLNGIAGATVKLLLPDERIKQTDENGTAILSFPSESKRHKVRLVGGKQGFEDAMTQVVLNNNVRVDLALAVDPVNRDVAKLLQFLAGSSNLPRQSELRQGVNLTDEEFERARQFMLQRDLVRIAPGRDPAVQLTSQGRAWLVERQK